MPFRSLASLVLLFSALWLDAQSAEGLFQAGSKAFQDGLFLMAGRSFRQLAEQYPDDPLADDAEYMRALAEFYRQDFRSALSAFSLLARRHPDSPFSRQAAFWAGSCHYRLAQYAEAVSQLTLQLERFPQEQDFAERALLLKGAAQEKLGRWGEALRSYRQLLDRKPAEAVAAEALFRLGSVQLELEDFGAALASFTRVLVDYPEAPQGGEALFYIAESLFFTGRYAEAERRYRLVLDSEPEPALREASLYRLARSLQKLARYAEALKTLEALERDFPQNRYAAELPLIKAELLFDLERYAEALPQYRKALGSAALPADRQRISYNLALAALAAGDRAAALQPLAASAQGRDEAIAERSLFRLAAVLADLGRGEEALRALGEFRSRFPASQRSEEALALQASLYEQAGAKKEAQELFSRLLTRYPDSARRDEYLYKRAVSRLESGDASGALKDFFAVEQSVPGSAYRNECLYSIGFIYSQRGEFARALPYFQEAAERAGGGDLAERSILAAGVCLFNTGEYAKAVARFELVGVGSSWEALALYYAGRSLYKLDRLVEAEKSLARASGRLGVPEAEEALYWHGICLFRLNRLAEAGSAFLDLAERYPESPSAAEALYRVGMCASLSGEHARSVAYYDRAIAAAERIPAAARGQLIQEALFQKGASLAAAGSRSKAEAAFRTLVRDYPEGNLAAEGLLSLAQADFRAGDFAAALAGFRKVSKEFPRQPAGSSAMYWAGVSAGRLGERGEALELLLRYLESSPQGGLAKAAEEEIRSLLASLAAAGEEARLREFAGRVAASRVNAELKNRARFEYARFLAAGEETQEEALRQALRLREAGLAEPLASETNLLIGEAYERRGELERALDIFSGVTASRAGRVGASAQAGLARIAERQGRREEAAEEYLKLYFLYPDEKDFAQEGLFQAGRLYWETGRRDQGGKLFEKLSAEFPESPWLQKLPSR